MSRFRLDRIWERWLAQAAGNPWIMNPPGPMLGRILHRAAITGYLAFGGTDGNTLNVTHRHRLAV